MNSAELISCLNYDNSPYFLTGSHLYEHLGYAHTFRLSRETCGLKGVYTLKTSEKSHPYQILIPAVYICEADSEQQAKELHRLVWNQNIVPLFLVETPKYFRLYPGFRFDARKGIDKDQSILKIAKTANEVLSSLSELRASSIDSGEIWSKWGNEIRPESRVDYRLLKSLKILSSWLQNNKIPKNVAHALIGKYVYLHYLKDRGILSDRKLMQWEIDKKSIFGRDATLPGFLSVTKHLDSWLNGTVFPIPDDQSTKLNSNHISMIAGTFSGDDPETGQMHLDFKAYDFQYIPIETLSMVYQQFLHSEGKGKGQGAFYTPIHLVNFILDELDKKAPLKAGMKVFDPACGSGAFLVQCYRRIIEREINSKNKKELSPFQLRKILTDLIHGVEVDEEACGVTELSLILTLLDYVDPPDLEKSAYKKFTLPSLRNKNICHCPKGFLDIGSDWSSAKPQKGYDWIVGNPPWKKLNSEKLEKGDKEALSWINKNKKRFPVSGNQIAEAFAWEVTQHLSDNGIVGMLMPAGSLFKTKGKKFRQTFFGSLNVWCVANFANLRHILFQGAINPAAAFFYSIFDETENPVNNIVSYTPFALHQVTKFSNVNNKRNKIWTIIINANEVKEVHRSEAEKGNSLPWKLAMWGSIRDKYLITSITRKYPSLRLFIKKNNLNLYEGFQLRAVDSSEPIEYVKEVEGKNELNTNALVGYEEIYAFPQKALKMVESERSYIRKRGGLKPLQVCYPPHIIVSAARKFAIFSNEFIVVPPRQVGIAGNASQSILLKALACYLNSNFAIYHQFLSSPSWGIERDVSDKSDLENLPIPLDKLTAGELKSWARIYDELSEATLKYFSQSKDPSTYKNISSKVIIDLKQKLNSAVYELLEVRNSEKWLIDDLLSVRKKMNEGKCPKEAINLPNKKEIYNYASALKKELDNFLDAEIRDQHHVKVSYNKKLAIVIIHHPKNPPAGPVEVREIKNIDIKYEFDKLKSNLLKENSQWVYFNHNLKIYKNRTTYLVKPMQRLSWLRSQALLDADEFIAEKLTRKVIYC